MEIVSIGFALLGLVAVAFHFYYRLQEIRLTKQIEAIRHEVALKEVAKLQFEKSTEPLTLLVSRDPDGREEYITVESDEFHGPVPKKTGALVMSDAQRLKLWRSQSAQPKEEKHEYQPGQWIN